MSNPFFKNNGPYKISQILNELNVISDKIDNDLNVFDILAESHGGHNDLLWLSPYTLSSKQ